MGISGVTLLCRWSDGQVLFSSLLFLQHRTIEKIYKEQKKDTKNGTVKSTRIPWKMETKTKSFPE